jgi:hypothetical protein
MRTLMSHRLTLLRQHQERVIAEIAALMQTSGSSSGGVSFVVVGDAIRIALAELQHVDEDRER